MRKDRKFTNEEMLDEYIIIGAYMKIMCDVAVYSLTKISNDFGKTNTNTKKMEKISKELEKLRSDLEDSMPYEETTRICDEKGISPLDVFYGYNDLNKTNKKQMQMIYNKFLKKVLESED